MTMREAVSIAVENAIEAQAADKAAQEAQAVRDANELRGLEMLAQYPAVMDAATRLADRNAMRLRPAVGDISAETESETLKAIAAVLAASGMPASDDDRARMVSTAARQAAARCATRARRAAGGNDWRAAIRGDAPASEAPNAIENWSDDALIRRAARYTSGALTSKAQAQAVINGARVANLTPTYPRPVKAPDAAPMPEAPAGRQLEAHSAYWQARGWSDIPASSGAYVRGGASLLSTVTGGAYVRGGAPGAIVTRQGGSSFVNGAARTAYPAAEREFFTGTASAILAGAIVGNLELDACARSYSDRKVIVNLSKADKAAGARYGDERRPRRILWQAAATKAGAGNRGTFFRKVGRQARRLMPLVWDAASIPAIWRGARLIGAPIPAAIPAPAIPTRLAAIPAPPAPVMRLSWQAAPNGGGAYVWQPYAPGEAPARPPAAPYAPRFVSRGDDTYRGWLPPDAAPPALLPPVVAAWMLCAPLGDVWRAAPRLPLLAGAAWRAQAAARSACQTCGAPREGRAPASWMPCPDGCGIHHAPRCHHAA